MAKELQQTFKDLEGYARELAKLAKGLDEEKTKQLNYVITSIIVLLVAFRQSSHLGEVGYKSIDDIFI